MHKWIKINLTFFDESTLLWVAPVEDRKTAIGMLKSTKWIESAPESGEFYNTEYVFKWSVED